MGKDVFALIKLQVSLFLVVDSSSRYFVFSA